MRRSPLILLVGSLWLSACALDTGVPPSERWETSTSEDDDSSDAEGVTGDAQGSIPDGVGPEDDATLPPPPAQAPRVTPGTWATTFTTTLSGEDLILKPLGARRGFTGAVSAPDGSLHLEALP